MTLTYAETRRLYGEEVYHRPSRFIGELPPECVEEVRLRATVSRPVNHQRLGTPITANDSGYTLGQRVRHPKFGEGTIINMEGNGEHTRLQDRVSGRRDQMAGGLLRPAGVGVTLPDAVLRTLFGLKNHSDSINCNVM
ncbi:hypothetical protein ACNKHW_24450 [Shigella flexneri]